MEEGALAVYYDPTVKTTPVRGILLDGRCFGYAVEIAGLSEENGGQIAYVHVTGEWAYGKAA